LLTTHDTVILYYEYIGEVLNQCCHDFWITA